MRPCLPSADRWSSADCISAAPSPRWCSDGSALKRALTRGVSSIVSAVFAVIVTVSCWLWLKDVPSFVH